jgi:hypothetical protein
MPDVAQYLQRELYDAVQGQPVNDVAIYLPNDDAYASLTPGPRYLRELAQRLGATWFPVALKRDTLIFDDDALKQAGRVEKGALQLGTNRYQIVILPNVETMRPETYRRLDEFVRGGGILLATGQAPSKAPGLKAPASDHSLIKETSQRLFAGANAPARLVQDPSAPIKDVIGKLSTPDVSFSAGARDIGYAHRKTTDADIYFLANTSNTKQSVRATFRIEGMKAESWDPLTGAVAPASVENQSGKGSIMTIDLDPYASRILIFSKRSLPGARAVETPAGPSSIDISKDWQVSFSADSTPSSYSQLHSWTDDEATRYFSGSATYEKVVNVSRELLEPRRKVDLDFGEAEPVPEQQLRSGMQTWLAPPVREAAVVYLNDQRAGACPLQCLDVTRFLRAGENKFRVVVANTAMNYMAGHSLPDYRLLNLRYGERFQAQDMDKVQPITSGIVGAVRLFAR